jgi:hypothetical protein
MPGFAGFAGVWCGRMSSRRTVLKYDHDSKKFTERVFDGITAHPEAIVTTANIAMRQ